MILRTRRAAVLAAACAALVFSSLPGAVPSQGFLRPAAAQEEKPAEPKKEEPKKEEPKKEEPKTAAATKGKFTVVLELTGTFDAKQQWDVEVDTESWQGELEVEEAAISGNVEAGQVLAKFKTDKIDEALTAARRDFAVAKTNFGKTQDDARRAEETTTGALRRAEFDLQGAEIAWKRWQEQEKDLRQLEADLRIGTQRDGLADAVEELAQLEKMYKSDEITEETEDIVLKRNRRDLDRRRSWFGITEKRDQSWRSQDFPREGQSAEWTVRKARTDFEKAKLGAEIGAEVAKVEFEKAKTGLQKQEENLAKLERDRERFVLKAPAAGYAVRGSLVRGKWSGLEEPSSTLRREGKVKPNTTLFTIVRGGDVYLRTSVSEGHLLSVAEGQSATAVPGAAPKLSLAAKVARVARVSGGSDFDVFLEVAQPDARLLPGYSAKIKLTTVEKADAVTVPAAAVEKDGDKRFVHVVGEAATERREVETGETSSGRTEIAKGLSEGEKVLETAPKQK